MKVSPFTLILVLIFSCISAQSQDGLIGPGKGSVINEPNNWSISKLG